jgi:hypothetical protein
LTTETICPRISVERSFIPAGLIGSSGRHSKIDDADPHGMRDGVGAADRVEFVE